MHAHISRKVFNVYMNRIEIRKLQAVADFSLDLRKNLKCIWCACGDFRKELLIKTFLIIIFLKKNFKYFIKTSTTWIKKKLLQKKLIKNSAQKSPQGYSRLFDHAVEAIKATYYTVY
jgi:hypothetical protein